MAPGLLVPSLGSCRTLSRWGTRRTSLAREDRFEAWVCGGENKGRKGWMAACGPQRRSLRHGCGGGELALAHLPLLAWWERPGGAFPEGRETRAR